MMQCILRFSLFKMSNQLIVKAIQPSTANLQFRYPIKKVRKPISIIQRRELTS